MCPRRHRPAPPMRLAAVGSLVGPLGCCYRGCLVSLSGCGGGRGLLTFLNKLSCERVQLGPCWNEPAQGRVLAAQITLREPGRDIRRGGQIQMQLVGLLQLPLLGYRIQVQQKVVEFLVPRGGGGTRRWHLPTLG